jgi:DNA-binding transcriptional ArsR family regulator
MASVDELACITLENTLPVSKPTISYHTKILYQAGLISMRKSGRNYYYSLRRDVLHKVLDDLWELAPMPRPVVGQENGHVAFGHRQRRSDNSGLAAGSRTSRKRNVATDSLEEAVVLTW